MKRKISFFILLLIVAMLASCVYATETKSDIEFNAFQKANISDLVGSNLENVDSSIQAGSENDIMLINETATEDIMPINEMENDSNTINNDLYQIGEDITINQDINGNIYIMANSINIEKISIIGNVFLIAEEVNIKNTYISGSAYIIAEDIVLNSQIQDIYLIGKNIELGNSSYVSRSAKIMGEATSISGIIGTSCYINSNNIEISNDTQIEGILSYVSSKEAQIGKQAVISEITAKIKEVEQTKNIEKTKSFGVLDILGGIIKVLAIIGILYIIFKEKFKTTKKITAFDLLKTLIIGTCVTIFIPLISLISIITIIGAGIGLLIILIYVILLYISSVIASYVIATNIVKEYSFKKILGLTIIIYIIYKAICIVPIIGLLIRTLMVLIGVGYTVRLIFNRKKEEKQEIIVES